MLEQLTNTSITSLASLEAALEVRFAEASRAEMCGVKTLLAYRRDICFAEVKREDSEAEFASMAAEAKVGRGRAPVAAVFRFVLFGA